MVSHQLVYVTGMLEVILAPSGAGNLAWYPACLAGVSDGTFRLLGAAAAACEVFLVPGKLGRRP